MKMRAPLCFCVGSLFLACASSQPPPPPPPSEPPPVAAGPEEPPPPDVPVADGRPSLTAEECSASGGTVVGDIGDGATQRPDYVCANGAKPSGNISAPAGGPIGVEGAVCCPGASGSAPPGDSAPPGMQWQTQAPAVTVKDAWRQCAANDECVLVETACCDHCNGGKAVVVNKAHQKDAEKLRAKCAPTTACTMRACLTRVACENALCVLQAASGAP